MVSQPRIYKEEYKQSQKLIHCFLAVVYAICLNQWNIKFSL